jgi:hypothetical protein
MINGTTMRPEVSVVFWPARVGDAAEAPGLYAAAMASASFLFKIVTNFAPTGGILLKPTTETGLEKVAYVIDCPRKSWRMRTGA